MATTYNSEESERLAAGFMCFTAAKSRLSAASKFVLGAALQDLRDERAVGREHFLGEFRRRLDQRHDLQVIGLAVAGRIRRHVGEHHIGAAAEFLLEEIGGLVDRGNQAP